VGRPGAGTAVDHRGGTGRWLVARRVGHDVRNDPFRPAARRAAERAHDPERQLVLAGHRAGLPARGCGGQPAAAARNPRNRSALGHAGFPIVLIRPEVDMPRLSRVLLVILFAVGAATLPATPR